MGLAGIAGPPKRRKPSRGMLLPMLNEMTSKGSFAPPASTTRRWRTSIATTLSSTKRAPRRSTKRRTAILPSAGG